MSVTREELVALRDDLRLLGQKIAAAGDRVRGLPDESRFRYANRNVENAQYTIAQMILELDGKITPGTLPRRSGRA